MRDYLRDPGASKELVRQINSYWTLRRPDFQAWTEEFEFFTPTGKKEKHVVIRSNIKLTWDKDLNVTLKPRKMRR